MSTYVACVGDTSVTQITGGRTGPVELDAVGLMGEPGFVRNVSDKNHRPRIRRCARLPSLIGGKSAVAERVVGQNSKKIIGA